MRVSELRWLVRPISDTLSVGALSAFLARGRNQPGKPVYVVWLLHLASGVCVPASLELLPVHLFCARIYMPNFNNASIFVCFCKMKLRFQFFPAHVQKTSSI